MDNKYIFSSRGKKFNLKLKELLKKKLKDRYKIKGYSFSNSKNDSLQKRKSKNKKSFLTAYEEQQKTIQENEFRFAIEDYQKLKHNIYTFDWKVNEEIKKDNKIRTKNFPRDKINFCNLQEMLTEFLRNKNKHKDNKNAIIKSKIKLDNVNRSINKNRINSILSKVSLHFNKVKTKVNLGKNDIDLNEHNYKNLITLINESRKKLQKNNNISSTKKSMSLDIKSIYNIKKLKNKRYKINSKFNFNTIVNKNLDDIQNKFNNIDNIPEKNRTINTYSEGRKYINIYNNYNEKEKYKNNTICSNKIKNKNKYIFDTTNNSNSKSNIEDDENIRNRFIKRVFNHSRNSNSFLNQNFNSDSSNNNNNNTVFNTNKIMNKTSVKSAFKRSSCKVKNLPIYTISIEDILNEYYRIKKISNLKKINYRETHLMTFREIDKVIKIKEELLTFLLQQKFLNNQFPLKRAKRPNQRKIFIKKFKDNIESFDRRYLDSFIST